MDLGFTAKQFVGQFDGVSSAAFRQIVWPSHPISGPLGEVTATADVGDSAAPAFYKRWVVNRSFVILSYVYRRYGVCNKFRIFERAPG